MKTTKSSPAARAPSRHLVLRLALLVGPAALAAASPAAADTVSSVRCESQVSPVGLDVARPGFSWVMESFRRGARQSAYRLAVATDSRDLLRDKPDVWDSGKVVSSENAHVVYGGGPLAAQTRYHYRVLVWDEQGRVTRSSPQFFETGFLRPSAFQASFIGLRPASADERLPLVGARWVWAPAEILDAKTESLGFVQDFDIPDRRDIVEAELFIVTSGNSRGWERHSSNEMQVNDTVLERWAGTTGDPRQISIADALVSGKNRISILVSRWKGLARPMLIFSLRLRHRDGRLRFVQSDASASMRVRAFAQRFPENETWRGADVLQKPFAPVLILAPFGDAVAAGEPAALEIDHLIPAAYLRKRFTVQGPIKQARLYVTSAGVHQMSLNGRRAGDDVLSPGWTDYAKRLYYRTHDVTALLGQGQNTLGGIVAEGWYAGRTGVGQHIYGFEKALLAELHIQYRNGRTQIVGTDASWEGATGPIRKSDFLDGEIVDARHDLPGWDRATAPPANFRPVHLPQIKVGAIVADPGPPVRVLRKLKVQKITRPAPGVQIFDLGQNMVGWVQLQLQAKKGTQVRIRYAEMLNLDGSLFTANLRSARATDWYIAAGRGQETFAPTFSFHGFRYVEVTGLDKPLGPTALVGLVVGSDLPESGSLRTWNESLDRLQSNIVWGQRGNYLSIPTDCPQRDERLGWTGDIQVFARTGTFNMDSLPFLAKYMIDLEDGQTPDGSVPDIAPVAGFSGRGNFGWGDAIVILPHILWQIYGDTRIIARHFDAMKKWVDFRSKRAKGHLDTADSFGDWLAPTKTPDAVLGPIYHAHTAHLLSRMAHALGKKAEADRYAALFSDIRNAWKRAYLKKDGTIESDTQTAYVLALRYEMLTGDDRKRAVQHLLAAIARADKHLATGFLGTAHLLPTLSLVGQDQLAHDLLHTRSYPSWLYTVDNGATTMWERWDSYDPKTGPSNKGAMNSYNHYAFGAVGEWMYAHLGGIAADPEAPGFANVLVQPRPGGGVDRARATYRSVRGPITTNWRVVPARAGAKQFVLDLQIPVHATATVFVPTTQPDAVTEGGRPASQVPGVKALPAQNGAAVFQVASGSYQFRAAWP